MVSEADPVLIEDLTFTPVRCAPEIGCRVESEIRLGGVALHADPLRAERPAENVDDIEPGSFVRKLEMVDGGHVEEEVEARLPKRTKRRSKVLGGDAKDGVPERVRLLADSPGWQVPETLQSGRKGQS
jgi:hypothetical protein